MSRRPEADFAEIASEMARILEREPELGDFGFGVFDPRGKTHAERAAELAKNRARIQTAESLRAFMAARGWLRQFAKTKAPNPRAGSSYGLKHVAAHDINYVTNGVFIAAALAEGFKVERIDGGPNAWLNISAAAWRGPSRRTTRAGSRTRLRLVVNNGRGTGRERTGGESEKEHGMDASKQVDVMVETLDDLAGWSTTRPTVATVLAHAGGIVTLIAGAPRNILIDAMKRIDTEEAADALHSLAIVTLMLLSGYETANGGGNTGEPGDGD